MVVKSTFTVIQNDFTPDMLYKDQKLLADIKSIVIETMHESNYSLEFICQSLFLSRSQLHRRIKAITGLSTTYFIRKIRIGRASELLQTTDLHIFEIAIKVGINSPQNFSKYYKDHYGVTPTKFRNQMRKVTG